jgi:sulfide:quinone oxidoreductase
MVYESSLLLDSALSPALRRQTDIWLVTPAPTVGQALGHRARHRLLETMQRRHIHLLTNAEYVRVDSNGIHLRSGYLPANAMVWIPPYTGSPLARASHLDDGWGWVPVNAHLQHPEWPNIYAVGDITIHVPKLAHSAMVQARVAVHHWWAQVTKTPAPPPYHPQVLCLIDIGHGQGFFALNTTLYGDSRDLVHVGPAAQWAKRVFNRAYVWGRGALMVMP